MPKEPNPERRFRHTTIAVDKEVAQSFRAAMDECKAKTGIRPNHTEMLALALNAWRAHGSALAA